MQSSQFQMALICGSVRDGRFGPTVTSWIQGRIERRNDIKLDVIDLAETPLPLTQQALPVSSGKYTSPHVRAYADRIGAADAFVVVTPEYNHGYSAALKLAIDSINPEWRAKPVGFISYGGHAGGQRAVEQLRPVFAELRAVTIRETLSFPMYWKLFDENGMPKDAVAVNAAAEVLLDELAWWATALKNARATTNYPGV